MHAHGVAAEREEEHLAEAEQAGVAPEQVDAHGDDGEAEILAPEVDAEVADVQGASFVGRKGVERRTTKEKDKSAGARRLGEKEDFGILGGTSVFIDQFRGRVPWQGEEAGWFPLRWKMRMMPTRTSISADDGLRSQGVWRIWSVAPMREGGDDGADCCRRRRRRRP